MSYISDKQVTFGRRLLIISLVFLILGLFLTIPLVSFVHWPPFETARALQYPVYAHKSAGDLLYIIDSSSRRIINLSIDGYLGFSIEGGERNDSSFFYAREIASLPDENLVVLNHRLDEQGFYLTHEELQLYNSKGEYQRTLVRREYSEDVLSAELVQRGRFLNLTYENENLWWYEYDKNTLTSRRYDLISNQEFLEYTIQFPGADLHIASMARISPHEFLAVLKDGSIGIGSFEGKIQEKWNIPSTNLTVSANLLHHIPRDPFFKILYRYGGDSEGLETNTIPWSIGYTEEGIVFTDLIQQSVQLLNAQSIITPLISASLLSEEFDEEIYPYYYYQLTTRKDGTVITTNDEGVVIFTPDSRLTYITEAKLTTNQRLLEVLFWFGLLTLIIGLILGLRGIYLGIMKGVVSPLFIRASGLSLLILMVGGLSALIIIPNFSARYQDVVLQKISQMLQIIPKVINAEELAAMDSPEDYNSPEYLEIRSNLMAAFNENKDDWNKGYYFALYRIIDDTLFGFMYMNGLINPYYPFDWLEGEENPGVYDLAWKGEIATELITDISGDWIYGVGPIFDSQGNVIALFETGTDLYALQNENTRLIRNLILELLVVLIVIILLVVELAFFSHLLADQKKLKALPIPEDAEPLNRGLSGILFTRPIAYLFFTGLSMSVAFLPILSSRLYVPQPDQAADVIIALPLALETLGFGFATLFAGVVAQKWSWSGLFYSGVSFAALGMFLSGTAEGLEVLVLARFIVGIGSGLGYMGLRSIINNEKNQEIRSNGFSNFYAGMTAGINTGLVIGASLADVIGLQQVFFLATGILVLVILLPVFIGLRNALPVNQTLTVGKSPLKGIGIFLTSPKIWIFFIGMILPTYIAGSFIAYYFPLFAESQGISTADIGRFLILNGLFIVYFGPMLSRIIEKRVGNLWGSVLGSVFWAVGLLVAGLTGSLMGAVIALIIMGLTEGFAVNTQNNVFLTFPDVKKVGTDQAVGIFELMGKLGESLGPIIFGFALLFGARFGLTAVALLVAFAALFVPLFFQLIKFSVGKEKRVSE